MTQTKLRLSMEQIAALRAFADANGTRWKSKLRDAWMTGRYRDYPGTECYGYLQQVRNIFGTSWLAKFSFENVSTHATKSVRKRLPDPAGTLRIEDVGDYRVIHDDGRAQGGAMSMNTREAWNAIAIQYQRLAITRSSEGPAVQLACLVLADYCAALWAGQRGPSLPMIALAEHILGAQIDEIVAAQLIKVDATHRENAS